MSGAPGRLVHASPTHPRARDGSLTILDGSSFLIGDEKGDVAAALIAEGMRRYGFRQEAARVALALYDAAAAFEFRLPELFGGFERDSTNVPIEYPNANRPQAFAAGAPLLCLRTLLGLDVEGGRLVYERRAPEGVGEIRVTGLRVRGERVDLVMRAAPDDRALDAAAQDAA